MIIAFLDRAFVQRNARTLAQSQLVAQLEDLLYALRHTEGEGAFPRSAKAYLEEWASDDKGWLRQFYPANSDEPHFDLTPATEKALAWLTSLEERSFVGTESRLLTVFELLRQMVYGAETNAEVRIAELVRQRQAIDAQIHSIRAGDVPLMDQVALRERYFQVNSTARELLGDFRAVEQNFRVLDDQVRQQINTWSGSKGELLQKIFGDRDQIADSDQGKSFGAFWDFLMSPSSQEELRTMLEKVFALEALQELRPDPRFRRLHFDWLEAGEQTQRMVASLSQQLRRYVESQVFLEEKRIVQLIEQLQAKAIALRDESPAGPFMEIAPFAPRIQLPFDRPLHTPKVAFDYAALVQSADGDLVDAGALYGHAFVDPEQLRSHLRQALRGRQQVSLQEVVEQFPLEQGLAELVGYLALANGDGNAVVDENRSDTFSWQGADGRDRKATLQRILFTQA